MSYQTLKGVKQQLFVQEKKRKLSKTISSNILVILMTVVDAPLPVQTNFSTNQHSTFACKHFCIAGITKDPSLLTYPVFIFNLTEAQQHFLT